MTKTAILERENKVLKSQLQEAVELLSGVKSQVGLTWQEPISEFTSRVGGKRHNPNDWSMADRNGEQGI